MVIDFNGKLAVVTGAAGGIGIVCAKTLLESGAKVAVVDANEEATKQAVESLKAVGEVKGYVVDLSNPDSIAPLVTKIREEMGEISVLVQAAGLLRGKPGLEVTPDDWNLMLNVNARGLFFMMQQVVAQSMQNIGGGSIVNFASMAGIRGMHPPMCSAHYSASKGAVVATTMQGAVEWASLGVRVNAVAPGGVLTPAMQKMGFPPEVVEPVPLKKLSDPQDIANAVTFLSSDAAAMITGQTLIVDGGSSVVGY
ncbi:MAG: short-chain dehydrogenase/reductase [Oscillospiraceae bacterium]|nr:short-chain dehydrogenase/reductase [Oscillospiraceae bacterium]